MLVIFFNDVFTEQIIIIIIIESLIVNVYFFTQVDFSHTRKRELNTLCIPYSIYIHIFFVC